MPHPIPTRRESEWCRYCSRAAAPTLTWSRLLSYPNDRTPLRPSCGKEKSCTSSFFVIKSRGLNKSVLVVQVLLRKNWNLALSNALLPMSIVAERLDECAGRRTKMVGSHRTASSEGPIFRTRVLASDVREKVWISLLQTCQVFKSHAEVKEIF